MKIKFNRDVELETIYGFDDETDTITESYFERFNKGEEIEMDGVVNDVVNDESTCMLQFMNGSCAYKVQKSWFDVIGD
jgi:hypothetical protein